MLLVAKKRPRHAARGELRVEIEAGDAEVVAAAAGELEASDHRLIQQARTEPWTQTISRMLGPEGLPVGVC
jgi:hypothetical protein